jgi:heme-degrading monooxygenase HmoA
MDALGRTWGYLVVWEFHVRGGQQEKFEAIYGPNGDWAELFRQSENYLGTELSRDLNNPSRYVTLDFWTSPEAYEEFRMQHGKDYSALDAACEQLTEKEAEIGRFVRHGWNQ